MYAESDDEFGTHGAIYVMNADGTDRRKILDDSSAYYGPVRSTDPTWSPDGEKIAFMSFGVDGYESGMYVMNADGSGKTRIYDTEGRFASQPDWAPDGTKIAFAGYQGGNGDILTVSPNGSGFMNLTSSETSEHSPSWQTLSQIISPGSKSECKKGGWRNFDFKNQGQCIKAVDRRN